MWSGFFSWSWDARCPGYAMDIDCSFDYFTRCLDNCSLPGDAHASGPFDNRSEFSLGDPGVDYEGNNKCEYATSGAVGEPHWSQIFCYLLQHFVHVRFFNTVFVLVDNRDLTAPKTEQESLAHWPTSRLALHGPAGELCDLIYIPINLPGQAHLCWLLLFFSSQRSTLCCLTVIVCQSPCLKLLMDWLMQLPAAPKVPFLVRQAKAWPKLPSCRTTAGNAKSLDKECCW